MSFKVGDKIKAYWKGGKTLFPGTISSVNKDGTFDIQYDDGDAENSLEANFIIAPGSVGLNNTPGKISVGLPVRARFRGGSYYSGKIDKINNDGTFFILFDDGDTEPQCPRDHILLPGEEEENEEVVCVGVWV